MKLLKDKVVVVTGGCGLLGMEFVKGILRNGGICIISDIQDACGLNSKLCLNDEIVYNFEFTNLDINSKESITSQLLVSVTVTVYIPDARSILGSLPEPLPVHE